ncbi:NAD(P)-binding protein [Hypoxylon sp. NC1633]|nr:NAD(P)-binding protein [Hypoxylon sp. NC1633]
MSEAKRSVLITGCSNGGAGAALAIALHKAGLHVYATARNPDKMAHLSSLGIETLTLDVQSESSIAACVSQLSSLDMLVNNAGGVLSMPIVDVNITEAKLHFDLNLWAQIAVTQAFMPLLLKSPNPVVVIHSSLSVPRVIPLLGMYSCAKAALAKFGDILRFELRPFGVKVVELRTGAVRSNAVRNMQAAAIQTLPKGFIYEPARQELEVMMQQEWMNTDKAMPSQPWADLVVRDLLKKNPSRIIWKGPFAPSARLVAVLPSGVVDWMMRKVTGFEAIERILRKSGHS